MAAATVVTLLDRMHAIHALLGASVHPKRYYPNALNTAQLPLIVPLPRAASRGRVQEGFPEARQQVIRAFGVVVIVAPLAQGIMTESAQKTAEALFEALEAAYDPRDRLQLPGDAAGTILDGMVSARLTDDTGLLAQEYGGVVYAVIEFSLSVIYEKTVALV